MTATSDQHLRRSAQLRIGAEVADRPDARQLDRAQRSAEIRDRVEADDVRRRGRRARLTIVGSAKATRKPTKAAVGRTAPRRPRSRTTRTSAGAERGSQPHERAGVQHAEQERRDGGQRHQLTQPLRPRGQRHERRQDGQRPRRSHLLDAAPERVPVEQRRLRADDGRDRAQPAGLDDRPASA